LGESVSHESVVESVVFESISDVWW
jgi:hypothetical protein